MIRPPAIVDGWGEHWIDDLICDWCGDEWPATGDPSHGPDARQYVMLNIAPRESANTLNPGAIHLCPYCAEMLADRIYELLDQDVPMGQRPEDTETMCALPDDYYLWKGIGSHWWDEDSRCVRDADNNRVRYPNATSYKLANKQRKPYRRDFRKDRS